MVETKRICNGTFGLIETLWNVKWRIMTTQPGVMFQFNRNIVECKAVQRVFERIRISV